MTMTTESRLTAIALLFILAGTGALIQFGWALWATKSLSPGVALLLLPAGIGLLRKKERWRRIARNLVLTGIILVVALPLLGYFVSPTLTVRVFGMTPEATSLPVIIAVVAYALVLLMCLIWVYRLLCSEEVKAVCDQ